jgi:hypothetical protein
MASRELSPPGDPDLISMRHLVAEAGASFAWHSHAFDEFTLVTECDTTVGCALGLRKTAPNTLLLYHAGESHGSWSAPRQKPNFWVIHFRAPRNFYATAQRLGNRNPASRIWQLAPEQVEIFKWLFLQIISEQTHRRDHFGLVESTWLRLLLLSVDRWAGKRNFPALPPQNAGADLLRLWNFVNAPGVDSKVSEQQLRRVPNYDSLRHRFKKVFGCPPREMRLRLRIEQAKNLLLETRLSIKEIATQSGYARQHEFTRMFHKQVGISPTEWRRDPVRQIPRSISAK